MKLVACNGTTNFYIISYGNFRFLVKMPINGDPIMIQIARYDIISNNVAQRDQALNVIKSYKLLFGNDVVIFENVINEHFQVDTEQSPRFAHDCEKCIFLGQYKEYDLYFCKQGGCHPTVIARYGNEGCEYCSGLGFSMPHMQEAEKRAKALNLI